jgi:magnesium-transporting ATPase (P-type)
MPNSADFEKLSLEETFTRLKTNPADGLSDEEVRRRQHELGLNDIPEKE